MIRQVKEFFQQKFGNDVIMKAATKDRYFPEVDDHFTFAANANLFATTGGGYGAIIGKLVTLRGGKDLSGTWCCADVKHPNPFQDYVKKSEVASLVSEARDELLKKNAEIVSLKEKLVSTVQKLSNLQEILSGACSGVERIKESVNLVEFPARDPGSKLLDDLENLLDRHGARDLEQWP